MNLLSEIISKPVLNLYNGKIEGTIKNICFDSSFKKILNFKMFDNDEEEFLIDTSKIYSIGKNTVVIKNNEALINTINTISTKENNPINSNTYTISGEYIGKLVDIEFNDKFEVVTFITDQNTKIKKEEIFNVSQNIIINNTNKKTSLSNFKPKIKTPQFSEKQKVITILPKIEDNELVEEKSEIEKQTKEDKKEPFKIHNQPTPQKLIGNGNFLIGRKAIKTIYGLNNEIIIKKDNLINAKNLENAKKHSKLVELTVFSKIKR